MKTFEQYILELNGPVNEDIKDTLRALQVAMGITSVVSLGGAYAGYKMGPYPQNKSSITRTIPDKERESGFKQKFANPSPEQIKRYSSGFPHEDDGMPSLTPKKVDNMKGLPDPSPEQIKRYSGGFPREDDGMPNTKNTKEQDISSAVETAKDFIKRFEGFHPNVYIDVNRPAIGYGFRSYDLPGGMNKYKTMSQEDADKILDKITNKYIEIVKDNIKDPTHLNSNQVAALISFAYNVGPNAFAQSSVIEKLNQKDYQGAADSLLKWNRVKGRIWPGLSQRRQAERDLFLSAT